MFDSVVKIRLINKKTMNISVSEKWLSRKFYFWCINLTTFLEISESFLMMGDESVLVYLVSLVQH